MRNKIQKFVVVVSAAMVTALLVCFYYRARMPQDSIKRQDKGRVRFSSWNADKLGDITGSIRKRITRIYVTSAASKQIQLDNLSENGGVHIPVRTSGFVGVLRQNERRKAGVNASDVNSYHGSDHLQPNSNLSPMTVSPLIDSRPRAPAATKGHLTHGNTTARKTSEWIPEKNFKDVPPDSNCSDSLCSEYLMPQDWRNFKTCASRARARYAQLLNSSDSNVTLPLGKCHFMDGRNRAAIALVSFPGSGNTWVRGLLEQATGICTGEAVCVWGCVGVMCMCVCVCACVCV